MDGESRDGARIVDHPSVPSAPVLKLIDRGKLDAAIRVYSQETGISVDQAATVLRDAPLLATAREQADQRATHAQTDREARPFWAYVVGFVALLLLTGSAGPIIFLVITLNQTEGYGELILMVAGPPLGLVAIVASCVLAWCYRAQRRPSR